MAFYSRCSSSRRMKEADNSQRRKFDEDGMCSPLPWDRLGVHTSQIADVATTVNFRVSVEDLSVETRLRDTDAVASSHYRGGVHGENNILAVGGFAEEGDHAVVGVVEIDPLETLVAVIKFVEGWVFFVDVVEVLDEA